MCAQAAGVDDCQTVLRTVAAELAAKATLAIPAEPEVNEAGTIRGVFIDPDDELLEPSADEVAPKVYVSRILKLFDCSREVYIIAQVYVNRLLQKHPNLVIQAGSVNEMLLASVVIALKWHEEVCEQYPDAHYACCGGVSTKKLQHLEARFVELLGWELYVSPSEFHTHCSMAATLNVELAAKRYNVREEQKEEQEETGNDVPEEEEEKCEVAEPLTATITAAVFSACHEKIHVLHTPPTCDDSDYAHTCKGYEDDEDDDCLPGRPLWGQQSYWMPSASHVSKQDLPHVRAEEDAHSIYSFESDSEDCLPGKPFWGDQSYKITSFCSTSPGTPPASGNKEGAHDDDESDEDCLPGRPLWSTRSFRVASRCSTSPGTSLPESEAEEDWEEDGDCLPGRPLWSAQSYKASPFADMPLGSHKQFNSATNAHMRSNETIGPNKDSGLPFNGGRAANILENKLVQRMDCAGPTPPCTEGLVLCRATEIVYGKGTVTTSPALAGRWRAPPRQESAGTPQMPKCYTKQAHNANWLTSDVINDDPPCPWLFGDSKKPTLHSSYNQ
mmetsp:Transcript_62702/g.120714  ORF Transcript_62702/g.120714 Transcript_62702/m.120714 type:complete len:557 (-) Transcript_62702:419-2089(-)